MTYKSTISRTGERWVILRNHKSAYGEKYAISNYGRLVKFLDKINNGLVLKGSLQEGYPIWRYKKSGKYGHHLFHRLVAKYFLPAPSGLQRIVIHLNFKKTDNHYKNLKWATIEEAIAHQQMSPAVKKARKRMRENIGNGYNTKLSEAKVKAIRVLLDKGKTLKEIALKYDVSDMQVYRIKTGENWGHIK